MIRPNLHSDFSFIIDQSLKYPDPPFSPDRPYPEFSGLINDFDPDNLMYGYIRDLFICSGYDSENIGTKNWNPFRNLIKDGQVAIIKPNFVYEETKELEGTNCLITHASIIRPVIDYLRILQLKEGISFKIIIADIPIQGADFTKILEQSGLKALQDFYYSNYSEIFEVIDFRHKIAVFRGNGFFTTVDNKGDTLGYSNIHLEKSFLQAIEKDFRKFGSPGYGIQETYSKIADTGKHFYHIPNTILKAELFINIPKVKTHKKAGITIAMKNLIGINGEKAWIPHYRRGSIKRGGDEYDDKDIFLKFLSAKTNLVLQGRSQTLWNIAKGVNRLVIKKFFRKDQKVIPGQSDLERKARFLLGGDWYGNDTLWRSILDLNYMLLFCDKNGIEAGKQVRNYLCICDGIISGEGDGPLSPSPKNTGLLSLSSNPVINDLCVAKLMGFDWQKIPQLFNSVKLNGYFGFDGSSDSIRILEKQNGCTIKKVNYSDLPDLEFSPPPGWIGNV